MFLPAMAFVLGMVFFGTMAIVYLKYSNALPLNISSIIVFIIGAFPGALLPANIYGLIFGYGGTPLQNPFAIMAALSTIPIGGLCGGVAAIAIMRKIKAKLS